MNAKTFGTDAKYQESVERHNAKYGTDDPIEQGRMLVEAQRAARQEIGSVETVTVPSPVFVDRASVSAINYLVSLAAGKTPAVPEAEIRKWAAGADRSEVSVKIDWLKTQPWVTRSTEGSLERHNVPAGRYAVTGADGQTVFVKVDRPTEGQWAGRIFVKIQAGDDLHRTSRPTADALLAKVAAVGPQAAMTRYGREIGSCGHCGRTLTNEESREAGIGPVCRGKMGW